MINFNELETSELEKILKEKKSHFFHMEIMECSDRIVEEIESIENILAMRKDGKTK